MTYFIDQSGKIENTAKDTVIACVNNGKYAILIPSREKRRLQEYFRLVGKPRLFIDISFAAIVSLLAEKLKPSSAFTIDEEYPGHMEVIGRFIILLAPKPVAIRWKKIGKNCNAHDVAYKTYKRKRPPEQRVSADELWKLITKKAGGYLNFGLSPKNRYSAPATNKTISKFQRKSRRRRR